MRSTLAILGWTAAMCTWSPLPAQEPDAPPADDEETVVATQAEEAEEAERTRSWRLWFEGSSWVAQPVGADYDIALRFNPTNPDATASVMSVPFGTEPTYRWRVGMGLESISGDLVATYWSHGVYEPLSAFSPGEFIYGTLLAYPSGDGFVDDGLADAFVASTHTNTRDFRVDYYREAVRGERLSAQWFVGYRTIDHTQSIDVEYWSLIPPTTWPPFDEAAPLPDRAETRSKYSARGLEAGLEGRFQVMRNVAAEFGVGVAVLRGKLDVGYTGTNWSFDEAGNQQSLVAAVERNGTSAGSTALDLHLGLRWTAWRTMDIFAGFRSNQYQGVARQILITDVNDVVPPRFRTFEETEKGIGYEGFYYGVGYRF